MSHGKSLRISRFSEPRSQLHSQLNAARFAGPRDSETLLRAAAHARQMRKLASQGSCAERSILSESDHRYLRAPIHLVRHARELSRIRWRLHLGKFIPRRGGYPSKSADEKKSRHGQREGSRLCRRRWQHPITSPTLQNGKHLRYSAALTLQSTLA